MVTATYVFYNPVAFILRAYVLSVLNLELNFIKRILILPWFHLSYQSNGCTILFTDQKNGIYYLVISR